MLKLCYTTLFNYIGNVPVKDGKIMISFDVTSLYTIILIVHTVKIIKDYVHNDDQFTREAVIPQDKFLDLVSLVLTSTWSTFHYLEQFYQQTNAVAIEWQGISITAETYLQVYEKSATSTILHPPKVLERLFHF